MLGWTAYVLSRPEAGMISYMQDDAFYYLVPAYSFAHGQGWTFDLITRTSGFQLLYAYIAAFVSLLTGYSHSLVMIMTLSSALALLVGLWCLLARSAAVYGNGVAAAAVALSIASPQAFRQLTSGLEWGWAVMMTALFVAVLSHASPSLPAVAATAFVVVLTRVDLSLFVAVFASTFALSYWQRHVPLARNLRGCLAAAGGAAAALVLAAIHSYLITGNWIPNSVAVKGFWSQTNPFLPAVSWQELMVATGPGAIFTSVQQSLGLRSFIIMGAFAAGCAWIGWSEWQKGPLRRAWALASVCAIAAYSIAYARGANLNGSHYSSSVVVPLALLTCGTLAASGRHWKTVAGITAIGCTVILSGHTWKGTPQTEIAVTHAGRFFATLPEQSRVGAWNAGIAGWKTGRHVTNLDGLGNASVVDSIKSGRLACYLSEQHIDHLMDWDFMFAPGLMISRNGYDPPGLRRCVSVKATAVKATADDVDAVSWQYRLFAVDGNCVAEMCRRTK